MKYPIGIDDFKELIQGQYLYIDKSLLIKDILDNGSAAILITRPRRFGKTINMSMLYYYLTNSDSEQDINLFNHLDIAQYKDLYEQYFHKYPCIFLSFKEVKKNNFAEAFSLLKLIIARMYQRFEYLLDSNSLSGKEKSNFQSVIDESANKALLENSLYDLTAYLKKHTGIKPIVLIDEYDTPVHTAYNNDYYAKMMDFLRSFLGSAFKGNVNLQKAVMTGITQIAQESIFSGLNNINSYPILRAEYGQYFGFTEVEVSKLLQQYKNNIFIQDIKSWYNGYQIGEYILYNPWSILKCLEQNGLFKPYWINTSDNALIKKLLSISNIDIKYQFEKLLQGQVISEAIEENLVFSDLDKNSAAVWSLLLYSGYLKIISSNQEAINLMADIAIPNREVEIIYAKIIQYWFSEAINLSFYKKFISSLINNQMLVFEECLNSYISQSGSYFDFNHRTSEQVFHCFVLGLVIGLRDNYIINSNQEAGFGRYDVAIIPKDQQKSGFILEFKVAKNINLLQSTVDLALEQIQANNYNILFKKYGIQQVTIVGLAFCGKNLKLGFKVMPV